MVAHKGSWSDFIYPQNTIDAMRYSVQLGYEAVELDIMLTKDEIFVLSHDDKINEVSNCGGKISQYEFNEVKSKCFLYKSSTLPLTNLLAKRTKMSAWFTGLNEITQQILPLNQIKTVMLDIKENDPDLVMRGLSKVLDVVSDRNLFKKIYVFNTNFVVLRAVKNQYPEITTLLEGRWGSEPLADFEKYIDRAGQTHDAISLNLGLPVGNSSLFKNLFFGWPQIREQMGPYLSLTQHQNIQTVAWTVNDVEKIKEIKSWNIEFILTDLLDQGALIKN